MYAANAAAGINKFGKENVGAAEIEVEVLGVVVTLLISGQMVELIIKELEIQTWGRPFVTVDVITPAVLLAFNFSLPTAHLTVFLHNLRCTP